MPKSVHITIVLDRSGSMESCRTDAIGAVNGYLRQVKGDAEMAARISLVTFDSQSIDVIRDRVAAKSCPDLDPNEYQPRAGTPLLDAVGSAAALLARHAEQGERCILAVMTDGLENASREYTKDQIKALLERKQKEDGWLVVYLGAGHDSWAQAGTMGIDAALVADFHKSNVGATSGPLFALAGRYVKGDASAAFTTEERAAMKAPSPREGTKTGDDETPGKA